MDVFQSPLKYYLLLIPCLISRLFGVMGFSVTENLTVQNSIMSRIYGVAIFIGSSIYFGLQFKGSTEFYNDNYRKSIIFFEFVVYWCVTLACIFLSILMQNKLGDWVREVLDVLKRLKIDDKVLKKMMTVMLGSYVLGFVFVVSYSQLSFFVRPQPNMTYVAQLLYLGLCSILMVILLEFINGVLLIFVFFKEINKDLLRIFEGDLSNKSGKLFSVSILISEYKSYLLKEEEKNSEKSKGIQNLSTKHHYYCVLAVKLNECFSLQILFFTALCFIELTYSMYYMILSTQCSNDTTDVCISVNLKAAVIFAVSWLVFYAYQLAGCAVACQKIKDEANHTALIIHQILNKESDKKVKNLLEIFSLQIHQWKLELTAFGFFAVDNTVLYTMVGSVTSALVILIQFRRYSSSSFSINYQNFTRFASPGFP